MPAATTTAAATAVQDPASRNPDGEFAPPPDMANHVNEPPPPINDPFNNPKGDDEEGDFGLLNTWARFPTGGRVPGTRPPAIPGATQAPEETESDPAETTLRHSSLLPPE